MLLQKLKVVYHRYPLITSLSVLILFGATLTFATPPVSPYTAGETLDPTCAPGDANCTVTIIPDQTGNSGKYLTTDGTSASWVTISGAGISSLNGLAGATQTFATGTSGTDFAISSVGTTHTFNIPDASGSARGLLTSTDWSTFNGKENSLTFSGPLSRTGDTISITQSGTSTEGYLSSGDWNTFNDKISSPISVGTSGNTLYTPGLGAGQGDTVGGNNIFFGVGTGNLATNVYYSNFIGNGAGSAANNASSSNFFGSNAGNSANNASSSNFFGFNAGSGATGAGLSNFFGYGAGYNATNAPYSNFFGDNAGSQATNAANSIFIGRSSGAADTVNNSVFGWSILIGNNTNTGGFQNSILLGGTNSGTVSNTKENQFMLADTITDVRWSGVEYTLPSAQAGAAGYVLSNDGSGVLSWAENISSPIAIGTSGSTLYTPGFGAGEGSTVSGNNLFFGLNAGSGASGASNSSFLGPNSGVNATNASNSNFFGDSSGSGATNASNSNFFGVSAGNGATDVSYSNFFGDSSGSGATNASYSNFFGLSAGISATNASYSNFFGNGAGNNAIDATESNFLGQLSGVESINASYSNFLGSYSGSYATNASYSNFFGSSAGAKAANASNSIFLGRNAGYQDTVDNTQNGPDDSSILIGNYTNTGGFSNSILLGSGTSGVPISNTKTNQFMLADTITDVRWSGVEYTLPSAQAGGAGYVLSNDGSGVLSWAADGATLPTNQIAFGDNSNLITSNGSFTYDSTNEYFSVGFSSGQYLAIDGVNQETFITAGNGGGSNQYVFNMNALSQQISIIDNLSLGQLFLIDGTNGGAITFNNAYTFPTVDGAAGEVLTTNGSGVLTWEAGGGPISLGTSGTSLYTPGLGAEEGDTATGNNIFLGVNAGLVSTNTTNSNFFGADTGAGATDVTHSNFLGSLAGGSASSASYSNFLGNGAGRYAASAYNSNFLGGNAGNSATFANDSNFLGNQAGKDATNAANSNFLGYGSGLGAVNASSSNFIGYWAGIAATEASNSNFFGYQTGYQATNASLSNFFGVFAGQQATNASSANFLGHLAGYQATNAKNSIFIGNSSGVSDTVDNTSSGWSILLGSCIKTGGFSNSVLIGGGSNSSGCAGGTVFNSNTAANQFMLADSITKLRWRAVDYTMPSAQGAASSILTNDGSGGLTWNNPFISSSVAGTTDLLILQYSGLDTLATTNKFIRFTNDTGTTQGQISGTGTTGNVLYTTTSDARLKHDVVETHLGLTDLMNINIKDYVFNADTNNNVQTGILAQELYNVYPQAVATNGDTGTEVLAIDAIPWQIDYGKLTPLIIKSVQELNLTLTAIDTFAFEDTGGFAERLRQFFETSTNGIRKIFVKEVQTDKLCVGTTCVTESQLQQLLNQSGQSGSTPASSPYGRRI
jgi:hypothetical protein